MKPDPTQFFITKIAKDDPNKLIDPGEAAAAGWATVGGPIAQTILPTATTLGVMSLFGQDPVPWKSVPHYGEKYLGVPSRKGTMDDQIIAAAKRGKTSLLNLVDVHRPINLLDIGEGRLSLYDPKEIRHIQKIAPTVNKMIDKYKLTEKGVRMDIGGGPLSRSLSGPSYNPATKRVKLPWMNEDYVLHELGHAAHLTKPGAKTFDMLRNFISKGLAFSIPMSYIAGNEIQKAIPGKIDDKAIKFIQDHAPAIMASSIVAADVYPEVQATTRAVKHVYEAKGASAARQTLKNLLPPLASYLVPIIPAIVGLSVARKYFKKAKEDEKNEKTAGVIDVGSDIWQTIGRPFLSEMSYMGQQVMGGVGEIVGKEKFGDVLKHFYTAASKTAKSPEFVTGALYAGIPTAALTYAKFNTPHGKIYSEKKRTIQSKISPIEKAIADLDREKSLKQEDRLAVPIVAGVAAAISGGILSKFFTDLGRVL